MKKEMVHYCIMGMFHGRENGPVRGALDLGSPFSISIPQRPGLLIMPLSNVNYADRCFDMAVRVARRLVYWAMYWAGRRVSACSPRLSRALPGLLSGPLLQERLVYGVINLSGVTAHPLAWCMGQTHHCHLGSGSLLLKSVIIGPLKYRHSNTATCRLASTFPLLTLSGLTEYWTEYYSLAITSSSGKLRERIEV